jgi:hypothetical protein
MNGPQQNASAGRAADLLIHYFAGIAHEAGFNWVGDNASEIRTAVDHLMDAARDIARQEIEAHRENEPHLHADGSSA